MKKMLCCILIAVCGAAIAMLWSGANNGQGRVLEACYRVEYGPRSFYPDLNSDIPWSAGYGGVSDIQSAFNSARSGENGQLGTSIASLTMPSQSIWDSLSSGEKALWLINSEREVRGLLPLYGVPETNVTSVAQGYAEYLIDNDAWGHYADGKDPWIRMNENAAINACHDNLPIAENLAVFMTSGTSIDLPVERAVYMWIYDDSSSSWGHRHAILYYPYDDNSGPSTSEGFFGLGRDNGGPWQGWNHAEMIVMNVFDPCSSWDYSTAPTPTPAPGTTPEPGADPTAPPVIGDDYCSLAATTAVSTGGTVTLAYTIDMAGYDSLGVPLNFYVAALKDPLASTVGVACSVSDALSAGTVYIFGPGMSPYVYTGRVGTPTYSGVTLSTVISGVLSINIPGNPALAGDYVFALCAIGADTGAFVRTPLSVQNSNLWSIR